MKDLDISNIESKTTVVVVSNQSEYDQLMQHLEKEGKVWPLGDSPVSFQPYKIPFPFGIAICKNEISWMNVREIDRKTHIPFSFPEYAAKHINPKATKRKRKRIEKSKYDALMADLAQTSRYADELFQKLEQAVAERKEIEEELLECRENGAMAVYVAVVATICALVLSMAVWMGALIPKI